MKFGENLKSLRNKKNITQEKLAELIGVSRQSVSKWGVWRIISHDGKHIRTMQNIQLQNKRLSPRRFSWPKIIRWRNNSENSKTK